MAVFLINPEKVAAFRTAVFKKGATNQEKRDAWIEAAAPWEHTAIIEAERTASAMPAALFLLKHAPKLIDHLVPDEFEPVTCEQCAQAVDEPEHRWCRDCAARVFFGLVNRKPETE